MPRSRRENSPKLDTPENPGDPRSKKERNKSKQANSKQKDNKNVGTVRRRATAASTQKRQRGSIKEYFKGVRLEMKKVVWPTRQEMSSYTVIVLVTCAAFALVFWAVDSGVLAAIQAVCF